MQENKEYWEALVKIGQDLLKQSNKLDFGNILMELKVRSGMPAIIIRSANKNTVFKDNSTAKIAIEKSFLDREKEDYDGAQTFTVIWHKGKINRILLDEYQNLVL